MTRTQGEEDTYPQPELVRVGYVSGTHGVRGAIRIRLDNPDSDLLRSVECLTLAARGECTEYRMTNVRSSGRGVFKVSLDGVTRADDAAALRGAIVMIEATALPATRPGEFYYFEAVGCGVVTTTGLPIGTIEEVFFNGANEVWIVRDRSREYLLPVIEDVVKKIDLSARRVIIEAVPGLLD